MAESARKTQRLPPRRDLQPTPDNDASMEPTTPFHQATSVGPTPASRRTPALRTPASGATPRGGPAARPLPSRRIAPTTPHAIRALRERANAARTPGNTRRRSGRVQRETPRDILRHLSRALAREPRPAQPSPQALPRRTRHSALDLPDVEDGPAMPTPRLSMPLENMYDDDDSFHSAPPRQSLLPDLPDDVDGGTVQSLEFGRRAISEDPRFMFTGRQSERFGDLSELGAVQEEYEVDGTFINTRADGLFDPAIDEALDGDETTVQALTGRRDARTSEEDLGVFGEAEDDLEEPTFRFMIPERMRVPAQEDVQAFQDEREEDEQEPDDELLHQSDDYDSLNSDDKDGIAAAFDGKDQTVTAGMLGWASDPPADNDAELVAYREEESAIDRSLQAKSPKQTHVAQMKSVRKPKEYMVSEHGIGFPSFPAAPVKKLTLSFLKSQGGKTQLNTETLDALVRTTNDFFEQISIDLAAYAQHGGRTTIEESDVIALMKRTRKTTGTCTSFSLAQRMLPRELLQQLRMERPVKLKRYKRKRLNAVREEDEDDD